jgi:hypothetical protein
MSIVTTRRFRKQHDCQNAFPLCFLPVINQYNYRATRFVESKRGGCSSIIHSSSPLPKYFLRHEVLPNTDTSHFHPEYLKCTIIQILYLNFLRSKCLMQTCSNQVMNSREGSSSEALPSEVPRAYVISMQTLHSFVLPSARD